MGLRLKKQLFVCKMRSFENRRKSNDGEFSRIAASTSSMVTEIGLMVAQRTCVGLVRGYLLVGSALGLELPPGEELVSTENSLNELKNIRVNPLKHR